MRQGKTSEKIVRTEPAKIKNIRKSRIEKFVQLITEKFA